MFHTKKSECCLRSVYFPKGRVHNSETLYRISRFKVKQNYAGLKLLSMDDPCVQLWLIYASIFQNMTLLSGGRVKCLHRHPIAKQTSTLHMNVVNCWTAVIKHTQEGVYAFLFPCWLLYLQRSVSLFCVRCAFCQANWQCPQFHATGMKRSVTSRSVNLSKPLSFTVPQCLVY